MSFIARLLQGALSATIAVVLLIASASRINAQQTDQNWPQWRGPLCNGVAPGATPPLEWSEGRNIRWKVQLPGSGTSTPIVWGNRIFIQAAIPTGRQGTPPAAGDSTPVPSGMRGMMSAAPKEVLQFALLCIDRQTGKTLWQRVAREEVPHEGHHRDHGFASYSPVTDGKLVWAYFGSRGLYCFDLEGALKWQKDLGRMRTKMSFGEGSSPALFDNTLVVNWDHEGEDFVAAFNATTGDELWRQKRDEDTSWATPLVVQHDGQTQVVISATKKIRSYDLKTGKPIWECAGMTANVIPTPVAGHGMVYCISGFRGNALLAIRLGNSGDLAGTDAIAFKHGKGTPYVPCPLLAGERLYFLSGNTATLSCLNAKTGQVLFDTQRLDGPQGVYASPMLAAGRVYIVGRDGTTAVLKDADKLEVLAVNRLDDKIDASPVAVGDQLLLRGKQSLYCIEAE